MVTETAPGTTVPVKVIRDKQEKSVSIKVDELDLESETGGDSNDDQADDNSGAGFGMTLGNLTSETARRLRMPAGSTGAVITDVDPNGSAARALLQPGDVILEVNRKPVANAADTSRELQKVTSGRSAFFLIWRRGQEIFVTAKKE
jgi:serine protease Do